MNEKNIYTARRRDIVEQTSENEILIYDLQANKMYCLNETSAQIFRLCDGAHSVGEISRKLTAKLKNPVSEDLVWLAIEQLKQNELLTGGAEISTKFEKMSRREIVKKIGFGAMIALPIVSSLVAPTAASASSTCPTCTVSLPPGQICSVGGNGCVASNALGYNSTPCPGQCQFCACTIPNGANSCTSTCGTNRGF
jgi:Coenzyme PQQ synthesis protein D (PqqD)